MSGRDITSGKGSKSVVPDKQAQSSQGDIAHFLDAARSIARPAGGESGRLIFALDATMSRQPTWDAACMLQSEMFNAVGRAGGLNVQLVYFRGFGECRASKWVADTTQLRDLMVRIDCRGGHTQIAKILKHARDETVRKPVSALVFIGDAMEENIDRLCQLAGELGMRKVPCFMFQEGGDVAANTAFREIARLSGGAYLRFDGGAANALLNLLKAVAVYASGGVTALEKDKSRESRLLLEQLSGGKGGS
ncbi:VWA domain-containing protein [Hoeflea prorocentri]|uniref:VWA domain-containing protein n=1 Tax=Hoeflea prorocentri TaxID=1922333 RepID=A0A9X3UK79_9HYPH|nr:VWA domain-containing protein [Hoeflea prorocentri]MCY6380659.1 VWA domain-containing protein [Hoeflea prorocentri]MDA5398459.1 VWA domain-containing protein [Hoeflea prorocentri]